jgi:hypothetical protein
VPLVFADAILLPECAQNATWRPPLDDSLGICNTVSNALANHPGPFRCVQITCCYLDLNREKIKQWLKEVANKGVKELAFINRPWPLDLPLPATLFICSSLTRLHIGAWKFPNTAALPEAATFPQLKELPHLDCHEESRPCLPARQVPCHGVSHHHLEPDRRAPLLG